MKNELRGLERDVGDYLATLFLDCATELFDYRTKRNPDLSSIAELLSLLQTYQEGFEQAQGNMDSVKPLDSTIICALHNSFKQTLKKTYEGDVYEQYHRLAEDMGKIRRDLSDLTILQPDRIKSLMDFCMKAQEVSGSYTQRIAYHPI